MFNNVGRTCIEAMAATQGHTQSLHTNALDEAIALPTDFSARIARNTQLLLQQESGTTGTIDPWAGSYYVERLTHDLAERAWAHIQEAEQAGGMAEAIEQGIPKMRIEEAAARTQARIDSGAQKVIGVNTYRLAAEDQLDVLRVDNDDVYRQQVAKLERLRAERDDEEVRRALEALTRSASEAEREGSLDGNLLALAVDAARAKATVGEISDALEKVYGRHQAVIRTISGVFRDEAALGGRAGRSSSRCSTPPRSSRRPRAAGPASWSPRWARTATTAARRSSSPRSPTWASTSTSGRCSPRPRRSPSRPSTPTCTSSASPRWPPATSRCCPRSSRRSPTRAAPTSWSSIGGVIPPDDVPTLREMGAAAVFLPGTVIAESALDLLAKLREQLESLSGRQRQPSSSRASARSGGRAVSQAITLVESSKPEHRAAARELLTELTRPNAVDGCPGRASRASPASASRRSSRRSAPGSPAAGHRVGVLAVDPSSIRTGGSVLGDKTRMASCRPTRTPTSGPRRRPARSAGSPAPPCRR